MAGDSPLNTQVNLCNDCNKMSESATHDESNALYKFMCENIVGSEEHVKTIRMMNTVRDNIQSNNHCTIITIGSFGEGLEMKGSDLDKAEVIKCIDVCEDANIPGKNGRVCFNMLTEDTQPGYTKLLLKTNNSQDVLKDCKQIGSEYYLSNNLFLRKYANHSGVTIHGPCITDKRKIFDLPYCLHSKSWITSAKKWITRSKKSWPLCDVKQLILKHGVLFVPIGVKGSITEELEWRISFSVAEKLLVFTFNHTQLLCYALMKILLKDVIAFVLNVNDILCSYFLKTIMFWISEELYASIWKPENLISCFMVCFRRLIYYVKFSVCPHYFIPSNNLFKNKIEGQVQEKLLDQLNILNCYGWTCILSSEQLWKFDALAYGINKEPRFLHVRNVEAFLGSLIYFADHMPCKNTLMLEQGIHRLMYTKSSKIKSLYTYYISKLCGKNEELLHFDGISKNKSTYKQYKTFESTLLVGTSNDAVSGWLLFASFFYNRKDYKTADYILHHSVLKCTPDKLYQVTKLSPIHTELFDLNIFREMTIMQLSKFMILGNVILPTDSLPIELRIEEKFNFRIIPPVVYAHFLRCLCRYHFYNTDQHCWDYLQYLKYTIDDNYFIGNISERGSSYFMLGIIFQILGDKQSAIKARAQSLDMLE